MILKKGRMMKTTWTGHCMQWPRLPTNSGQGFPGEEGKEEEKEEEENHWKGVFKTMIFLCPLYRRPSKRISQNLSVKAGSG